jgi:hypothetical protein
MNYKGVQKAKRKHEIKTKWSLGKLRAEEKENKKEICLEEKIVKCPPGKKRWPCKRGKGEHKFEVMKEGESVFKTLGHITELKCSVCGKKVLKFLRTK